MKEIVGRCLDGVKVVAYVIKDIDTGVINVITKENTEALVLNKKVINCTGQIYNGKIFIKGTKCKLVDLPNYNLDGTLVQKKNKVEVSKKPQLLITGRITQGKHTIGYTVVGVSDSGQEIRANVDKQKVLMLAKEGKLANAKVQNFNNKLLLRGVNCDLAQLPSHKVLV